MAHKLKPMGTCSPNHLGKVRWKRHRTVDSILRAYFAPMGLRPSDVAEAEGMRQAVVGAGMWGFASTGKGKKNRHNKPTVHYWHDGKRDPLELAFLLGHEAGHLSGKPYRSRRNDWREEERADHYAHVVATVLAALKRETPRPLSEGGER